MNNFKLSTWFGAAILVPLVVVGGCMEDDSRSSETTRAAPQVSEVTVVSLGPTRLANRVKLAEVGRITMLQYYEKDTGSQWLYFRQGASGIHVLLPDFVGIQSDRVDLRGTRFDQVEHVMPTLNEVWFFSEAPTSARDTRLGYMSPVMISHYALTGNPLPTAALRLSSRTFGDDHSRTGALTALQSGGIVASWYQSYLVNPHTDRRAEIGMAYRSPRGAWSTLFPIAIDGSAGGGIMQSRQAMVQHPADDSIWLFNKRDSFHSIEVVHLSETNSGMGVDWIDPVFINKPEHGDNSVEGEFPAIMVVPDTDREAIILAYGDNRSKLTNCGGTCFKKVTHITVVTIAADGSKVFVTHSPFTIERTTRFGMALEGDTLWLVYKPWTLTSTPPPALALSGYDLRTGTWSPPLPLGEPFWASREMPAVFATNPLAFAHLMMDEHIHYFRIEKALLHKLDRPRTTPMNSALSSPDRTEAAQTPAAD